jgi:hypothetical protein
MDHTKEVDIDWRVLMTRIISKFGVTCELD